MAACRTLPSIRMTASPVRWSLPGTGGLSVSTVPRPRAPLKRRRRPARPEARTLSGWPSCPATTDTSSHSTLPFGVGSGFFGHSAPQAPGHCL
jgi:hypothetical protein